MNDLSQTKNTNDSPVSAVSRRQFLGRTALVGAGVAVAPFLISESARARGLVKPPSPAAQKKVGAEAAQQVLRKYRVVSDERARYFEEVGRRLVDALPRQEQQTWDFNFRVLDSKELNAFALPGGPMFLFTGLFERFESEDAVAAVTGHEMMHVRGQHWARAYARQQERGLLLGLGLSILKGGRGAQTLAGLADQVIGLKYGRGEEDEADKGGLQNLVAASYNPEGMIQLFATLQKAGGGGRGLGGDFLSSHPLTSDRIKRTQERIAQMPDRSFRSLTPLRYSRLR